MRILGLCTIEDVMEEIIGEEAPTTLRPRWSYASLAHGLKLDYRAYHPDVWPGYDPPEYVGAEGVRGA